MAMQDNLSFTHDDREICPVKSLPLILQSIYDFRALSNGYCDELQSLYSGVRKLLSDQFIESASEEVISKWEKYLKVTPNGTDTLEERRFRVLAKLNDSPPYTDRYLENKLNELCGEGNWKMFRDYDTYSLLVQLSASTPTNTSTVSSILRNIVPANISLVVSDYRVRYGELTSYTHEYLSSYTYDEITHREATE